MSAKLKAQDGESKLERAVRLWLNRHGADYSNGWKGAMRDLQYGGCQSGIVGDLIYYRDTVKFYKRHAREIDALLKDMLDECGMDSPKSLFGDKWDTDDPFARDDLNQNLLAWFGFEETANRLASLNGYDE